MLIWKKLGILGIVIPLGLAIILQLLFAETANYSGIGYLLGSIPVWYYGKKWNDKIDQENDFDPTTERISKHSMFWIHLEYWGVFFAMIGIVILFSENIFDIGTDPSLIIWGITLVAIIAHQVYKNVNKGQQNVNILDTPEYSRINKLKEKEYFVEIEKPSNKTNIQKEYKPTDHSRYMPKSSKEE